MLIKIPGVDAEKGLELYEDDIELYRAVLLSYVSNTPKVLKTLETVTADTLADYASKIHGIKGTSATIGAEETRKTALKLELMAKADDLSGVLAENDSFVRQTEKLIKDISAWLEQKP